MAEKKIISRQKKSDNAYLTKRILLRAAKAGIRNAAAETMELMGFTIIAHKGWIIKKYADGHMEKISKIDPVKKPSSFVLK